MKSSINNLSTEDSPYRLDQHGPIFLLGSPRSGTTFLGSCIGHHELVEEFVGVLAPPRLMQWMGEKKIDVEVEKRLRLCFRDIFWNAFWRRRQFRRERVSQVFARCKSLSHLFNGGASLEGVRFFYKEPFLCFGIASFVQEFPSAKFIQIIRNGLDVADSMVRSYGIALSDEVLNDPFLAAQKVSEIGFSWEVNGKCIPSWVEPASVDQFLGSSKFGRYLMMWKEMISRVQDMKLPESQYLEVKYEDFVKTPENEMKRILEFLSLPEDSNVKRALRKARLSSVGINQKRMDDTKRKEAANIAGDLLASLGYEL